MAQDNLDLSHIYLYWRVEVRGFDNLLWEEDTLVWEDGEVLVWEDGAVFVTESDLVAWEDGELVEGENRG